MQAEPKIDSVLGERSGSAEKLETRRMRAAISSALFGQPASEKLGRFVLGPLLGRGGMGSVYEAWDPTLGRNVALKVFPLSHIPPEERAQAEESLLEEGRVLAQLSHENVVAVHEAGVDGDVAFIAMQLVGGTHLGQWSASLPTAARARLQQVCVAMIEAGKGLAYIHGQGLVHGDIKPSNLLMDDDGDLYVADLGLARGDGTVGAGLGGSSTEGSVSGTVARGGGTPAYMAPEQHAGQPASIASDVYAFALTFAELCLGSRRLKEEPAHAWLAGEAGSSLPRRLRTLLGRGLDPDPTQRQASVDAMLRGIVGAVGVDRRTRWAATGAAVVLLAVATFLWLRPEAPAGAFEDEVRISVPMEDAEP